MDFRFIRLACHIKLAMNKTDEAERHAAALGAIAATQSRADDAMERAIAAITTALARRQQGRDAEAATVAGARRFRITAFELAQLPGLGEPTCRLI